MLIEDIIKIVIVILAILIIITVLLQPSQQTGLIGDATDIEKREKRGMELFLFRSTIVLTILFFSTTILYGAAQGGLI